MIYPLLLQDNVRAELNECDLIGYRQMRVSIIGSTDWAVGVGLLGPRLAGKDRPCQLKLRILQRHGVTLIMSFEFCQ